VPTPKPPTELDGGGGAVLSGCNSRIGSPEEPAPNVFKGKNITSSLSSGKFGVGQEGLVTLIMIASVFRWLDLGGFGTISYPWNISPHLSANPFPPSLVVSLSEYRSDLRAETPCGYTTL